MSLELVTRVEAPVSARIERERALAAVEQAEILLERETRSRRRAWLLAGALVVVCAAQAAAIAMMLPLKEVTPYTIVVDRSTGLVEAARPVAAGAMPQDEAVTQAMLAQYVIARETYDETDIAARYELVALWSTGTARASYLAAYRADNPANVVAKTPAGVVRRVSVRNVRIAESAGDAKSALVDFDLRSTNAAGLEQERGYRATIAFRYADKPMRMEDRLRNPLGFQVTAYRRDDTVPLVASTPLPAQTDAPVSEPPSDPIRAQPLASLAAPLELPANEPPP